MEMSSTKSRILGIARHVLTFFGGLVVARGLADAAMVEQTVGAIITIAGFIWSIAAPEKKYLD